MKSPSEETRRRKAKTGAVAPAKPNAPVPVVGIGASAGGLDALKALIPAIPEKSGIAFVVVQHLDPAKESVLSMLLGRGSPIPVVEVEEAVGIEADKIFVISPNTSLTIVGDRLLLSPPHEERGYRAPIDTFFLSLAEARGERAACVILSGTGSDGTLGLRAVKEQGGLTIAQAGAEYDGMMRSAVATGLVDFVLRAEEIPNKLLDYFRHLDEVDGEKSVDGVRQETADYLSQICALLRARTGHDFSGYKDRTVARRVQRRMQVLQIDEVPPFIERLRKDPQELDALLQDLLIGVTNFFRDPKAFDALETEVIAKLFQNKGPEDIVRVWVPGCSTGEEAYSIGILLREHMPKSQAAPRLQIFASDIDEQSLQAARIGRYPASIARDVPAKYLENYFIREDGTYRITGDLREMCLFSAHNLLRDAPFSKLDLISCRNLLIYLTPELQNRLIPLFHYALNDSGYLFLGNSENVTRHSRLFATVDKAHRIFQRRPQIERRLPEFPLTAPEGARRKLTQVAHQAQEHETLQSLAERQLLDRYSPAYVIISAEGDVLHASARTGKYFELAAGVPKTDVFSMARRGLRPDLRAGVHKAITTGQAVTQNNVVIGTNGGRQTINLTVQPLRSTGASDPLYMVIFQDLGGIKLTPEGEPTELEEIENSNLRQLEMELRATKERLQTTTEELESSNEELKSGNEELSSMNEELQSANEELETSKEELQSINEELQTVNAELNARVEELSRANSDIANLLESTQIATVFLDRNLAVKSFTPAAKDVFRLVESDTGRPITHVRARFVSDTVQEDAEKVLRTLSTIERQVESNYNDARYVMRMLPYRTVDNVIAGVVITFVDVTRITAAEERINELTRDLRDRVQSLETLLDLVPIAILIMEDKRTGQIRVNRYGTELLGEKPGETALHPLVGPPRIYDKGRELPRQEHPLQIAARTGEAIAGFEGEVLRNDGTRFDAMIGATPLFTDDGKVRGAIAAILDISDRKRFEAQQQVLLHELQHRVKNIITTIGALATRMLRGAETVSSFTEAFLGRLNGMARTHDLLTRRNWRGAGLRELITNTVTPYVSSDGKNVAIEGPMLVLEPGAATTLGMVFYELATNAAKYGALSTRSGHIKVNWRLQTVDGEDWVSLAWEESGGPRLDGQKLEGFGTGFAKRSVEYEISGRAELELRPTGAHCLIEFPVRRNVKRQSGEGESAGDDPGL
jgi:two-component system CheB/CheR fusion protein